MTVGLKSLPQAFVLTKNEGKNSFADWSIELASCGFGKSTDAFLKSVNNFLGKEERIIPFLKKPLAFPTLPQSFVMFYFTVQGYIFGIDCQTTLQVQEKLISRLPVEIYVQLRCWASCPDTGQHRSSAKILISRRKQMQKS